MIDIKCSKEFLPIQTKKILWGLRRLNDSNAFTVRTSRVPIVWLFFFELAWTNVRLDNRQTSLLIVSILAGVYYVQ